MGMYFMDMGEAGGIIEDSIRALSYMISDIVYSLIIWMYNIFSRLCNSRILDSDILETISERVGVILGIVMLFIVTLSVIQMVLEPDKLTDKEKGIGNIAMKIILVVIMLGVSNSTFRLLYGVQKNVIDSNIIQKILLPYEVSEDVDFGGVLSLNLFTSFYNFNIEGINEKNIASWDENTQKCYNSYGQLKLDIKENNNFSAGKDCVNVKSERNSKQTYVMSFNWLISPAVGIVVLYFVFSYCLSIGMRTIQLAFLEIISPMAIISYLSPKKDAMFQKWTKIYFSTYIDVFLRIMIINLVAFLITTLFENSGKWEFWESVGKNGDFSDTVILVLMVMALLMFAKKAPDLLKDLFPSSGGSKLGLGAIAPKKIFDNMLGAKQVKSFANNTVGLLGRKTIAGIDAKVHGHKFRDGTKAVKGGFGKWMDKQRETYLPSYNEIYKKRREGIKKAEKLNTNWEKGEKLAMNLGTTWEDALDGVTIANYRKVFSNEQFIRSKMNVDKSKSVEKKLYQLKERIDLEGIGHVFSSAGGASDDGSGNFYYEINGEKYTEKNVGDLIKNLKAEQKKLEGLNKTHEIFRDQNPKDAAREDQFDFYKNNDHNPTRV